MYRKLDFINIFGGYAYASDISDEQSNPHRLPLKAWWKRDFPEGAVNLRRDGAKNFATVQNFPAMTVFPEGQATSPGG